MHQNTVTCPVSEEGSGIIFESAAASFSEALGNCMQVISANISFHSSTSLLYQLREDVRQV